MRISHFISLPKYSTQTDSRIYRMGRKTFLNDPFEECTLRARKNKDVITRWPPPVDLKVHRAF